MCDHATPSFNDESWLCFSESIDLRIILQSHLRSLLVFYSLLPYRLFFVHPDETGSGESVFCTAYQRRPAPCLGPANFFFLFTFLPPYTSRRSLPSVTFLFFSVSFRHHKTPTPSILHDDGRRRIPPGSISEGLRRFLAERKFLARPEPSLRESATQSARPDLRSVCRYVAVTGVQ